MFRAPKTTALDQLNRQLGELDKQARNLGGKDPFKNIDSGAKGATGSVNGLNTAAKGLLATFGPLLTAAAALGAARFVFVQTAELEKQTKSLQTLTGSAQKAADIVQKLQAFANVTPFESSELLDVAKKLSAFGVESERIVTVTKRLGDVAGASGADLDGLALAYGQVVAKGRLQGEELLQFQERGVGVQQELQKMYNLSGEELQEALQKGKISSEALEAAIERLTTAGGKYADGANAQSDTLTGKMSTLNDSIATIARTLGTVLSPALKGILGEATTVVNRLGEAFTTMLALQQISVSPSQRDALWQQAGREAEPLARGRNNGMRDFPALRDQRFRDLLRQTAYDAGTLFADIVKPETGSSAIPPLTAGTSGGTSRSSGGSTGGTGFKLSSKAQAAVNAAAKLGVSPIDLLTIVGFETGGSFSPSQWGGAGGNYMGLIQFGPPERRQYGANANQSFEEQIQGPVVRYFQDRFAGVGMSTQGASLEDLYTTVLAGNPRANRDSRDSFGTSPRSGAARMKREFRSVVLDKFFGGSAANAGYSSADAGSNAAQGYDSAEERRKRLAGLQMDTKFGKELLTIEKQITTARLAGDEVGEQLATNAFRRLEWTQDTAKALEGITDPEERSLINTLQQGKLQKINLQNLEEFDAVQTRIEEKQAAITALAADALAPLEQEIDLLQARLLGTEQLLVKQRELAALTAAGVDPAYAATLLAQRDALEAAFQAPAYRMGEAISERQAELDALLDPVNQLTSGADALGDAFGQAFQDVASGSKTAGEALSNMFRTVGQSFLSMAAQMLAQQAALSILKLFTGGGAGAAGGSGFLTGGLFDTAFSYAGGGFTGNGPRSGGVDGQGGFPAILHPRESVIDHYEASRAALADGASALQGGGSSPEALFADTRRAIGGSVAGGTVSTSTALAQNQSTITHSTQVLERTAAAQAARAAANAPMDPVRIEFNAYDPAGAGLTTVDQTMQIANAAASRTQAAMLKRLKGDPSFRRGYGIG